MVMTWTSSRRAERHMVLYICQAQSDCMLNFISTSISMLATPRWACMHF